MHFGYLFLNMLFSQMGMMKIGLWENQLFNASSLFFFYLHEESQWTANTFVNQTYLLSTLIIPLKCRSDAMWIRLIWYGMILTHAHVCTHTHTLYWFPKVQKLINYLFYYISLSRGWDAWVICQRCIGDKKG